MTASWGRQMTLPVCRLSFSDSWRWIVASYLALAFRPEQTARKDFHNWMYTKFTMDQLIEGPVYRWPPYVHAADRRSIYFTIRRTCTRGLILDACIAMGWAESNGPWLVAVAYAWPLLRIDTCSVASHSEFYWLIFTLRNELRLGLYRMYWELGSRPNVV